MQMATVACAKDTTNLDSEYHKIDFSGKMENIGIAFHQNSKDKLCRDMNPVDFIETGGLFLSDNTVIDESAATAFKSKSFLSFVFSKCSFSQNSNRICGFTIESAFGVRFVSSTKDQKNIYFIHNANLFVHVKIDQNGNPYSFATKKIDYDFADALSENGIAEYDNITQEYERIFQKFSIVKSQYDNLSVYAFSSSETNKAFLLVDNSNRSIFFKKDNSLLKTKITSSDLENPKITNDGTIKSHGFTYIIKNQQIVENSPFTLSSGLEENLLSDMASLEGKNISFKKAHAKNMIQNNWKFGKKSVNYSCQAPNLNNIEYFNIQNTYFKKLNEITNTSKKTILYFFGGPSGQFQNEFYGETINHLIEKNYEVVVPYYGGSIGAGLEVSRKFYSNPLKSVESDSKNIAEYIKKNQQIDIIAYSFGAVAAINFAFRYPDKVDNIILVAPYIQHRDPSEYRTTLKSITYQRALENSWFGDEADITRPNLRKFLNSSYKNLENSKVKIHFIFGDLDKLSKFEDITEEMNKAASSIKRVKANHQFVAIHPDTNKNIYNILGI